MTGGRNRKVNQKGEKWIEKEPLNEMKTKQVISLFLTIYIFFLFA